MSSLLPENRDEREADWLNRRIGVFIERFEPDDPDERQQFHMALHDLVRSVYAEAAKPYQRTMEQMLRSMSPLVSFPLKP